MSTNQALWQARADALFNSTERAKENIAGMQTIVNIMTDVGSQLTVQKIEYILKLLVPILDGTLDQFLAVQIAQKLPDFPLVDETAAVKAGLALVLAELGFPSAPLVPDVLDENLAKFNQVLANSNGDDIFPETRPIIRLEKKKSILDNRLGTLNALLTCLDEFARKQWAFFHDGFDRTGSDPVKKGYLSYSKRYPEAFVYRATLDQIAFDLEVVQKAFTQSLRTGNSPEALKAIRLADKYVAFLLNFVDTQYDENGNEIPRLIGKTVPITYMGKSFQARIVPYAPVALIGVPTTIVNAVDYACVNETGEVYEEDETTTKLECDRVQVSPNPQLNVRDFLAISHEVGHYIFRHGAIEIGGRKMSIRRAVLNLTPLQPAWIDDWVEEIFADVFGAVVAGGAAAETAQEIQLDNDPASLLAYSTRYPVGALRPYIYCDVLHLIKHITPVANRDKDTPCLAHEILAEQEIDLQKQATGCVLANRWSRELARRGINLDTSVSIDNTRYTLFELREKILGTIAACLLVLAKRPEDDLTIETVARVRGGSSLRPRWLKFRITEGLHDNIALPDWTFNKTITADLPRPVDEIPANIDEFTLQIQKLLLSNKPSMLRLILNQSKGTSQGTEENSSSEIVADQTWSLVDNNNTSFDSRKVGETIRVSGGDIRDTLLPLLQDETSRFANDRLPPEIWEVVFSMNGWTTGGPEDDPVDPV